MKNILYILLLFFGSTIYSANNNGGRPKDVNINTQKELDNLEFISEVGNLIIASEGIDQITDLSNLKSIKNVKGSIYIINNKELLSLEGLSVSVEGSVHLQRNKSLKRLAPNFINGNVRSVYIKDNNSLENIDGFNNVVSIKDLTVEHNNSLIDLNGFSSLKEIMGDVKISNNDELKYSKPFVNVVYFRGSLVVENNKSLFEADGLYNLYSKASSSQIVNNTVYTTNVSLMKVISEGEGKLKFTTQEEIDVFGNCYKKKVFKGDIVIDKSSITNIDGLRCLNKIDGRLIIKRNDKLVSIDGLSQLVSIDNLIISFNKNLNSLKGLDNLSEVKNNVVIYRNVYLTDASSISENLSLGGKLVIKGNPRLNK